MGVPEQLVAELRDHEIGGPVAGQRGVLDDVGPDDLALRGDPPEDREGLVVGPAARLGRAGAGNERARRRSRRRRSRRPRRSASRGPLDPDVGAVHLAVRDDAAFRSRGRSRSLPSRSTGCRRGPTGCRARPSGARRRRASTSGPRTRRAGRRARRSGGRTSSGYFAWCARIGAGAIECSPPSVRTNRLRPSSSATTFSSPSTQAAGSMSSGSQPAACGRRSGRPPRRARRRRAPRSATPRGSPPGRSSSRRRRRPCARTGTGRITTRLFSSVFSSGGMPRKLS